MAPEKRALRVGLIGAGFMGEFHARAYATAKRLVPEIPVEVAAIAEPVASLRDAFGERWDVPDRTEGWREVIESSDIDIVDICTPPALHKEIALAAIEAGKQVYCEKPVGRTSSETAEIAAAARAAGVQTMVGFNYRWFPAIQHAREAHRRRRARRAAERAHELRLGLGLRPGRALGLAPRELRRPATGPWATSAPTSSTWLACWLESWSPFAG